MTATHPRLPVPTEHVTRVALVVGLLVALSVSTWLVVAVVRVANDNAALTKRADEGRADRADLRAAVVAQDAALDTANRRLAKAGQPEVEKPAVVPGPAGSAGADGSDGAASTVPGPAGADGADGEDGADSTVPGPAGVSGTNGAADDGSDGATGATGATGAQGPQGTAGVDGTNGRDGADSTVPGPPGDTGPAGESAYPFEFVFEVPQALGGSTTYTVTCTAPGACSTATS